MKNGFIVVLLLIVIAGAIYFTISSDYFKNNEYTMKNDVGNSDYDNSDVIRQTVEQTKTVLPVKVDAMTTFTDVIGGKNSLTYMYEVDMDLSLITPQQRADMKEKFPKIVCPQKLPLICGTGKAFFDKGIVVNTKYNLKDGSTLVECRYSRAECAKLSSK